ncbi:MAG TPA: acyl-CoA dehydrogenase family protein [Eoetvoesiella sp.]
MTTYVAPVQDWLFLLHDHLRVQDLASLPGFEQVSRELSSQIYESAAHFHQEELHPINLRADSEGATLSDGVVRTPTGYKEAWRLFREAGWYKLSLPEDCGGMGLPPVMSTGITEMRTATGQSFSMYSGFCVSTTRMLAKFGADWMKQHLIPQLVDGSMTATMSMTESQCGTDLRQLRTVARPQSDGTWLITGEKIFISGGDHDLTENIVHVVLAKVPDADGKIPNELSAVNVFIVPKLRIDPETGKNGERNGVEVLSLEEKMGLGGNATCALSFNNAIGWRVASGTGSGTSANMAGMFQMMNHARINTALQGIAYAEIASQNAIAYARDRLSGRTPDGAAYPDLIADPLIAHPDVRRLLLGSRAFVEGARATALKISLWQSLYDVAIDPAEKQRNGALLDFLTPVIKAFFTDRGFQTANDSLQVFGGHGYISDYGIEQYVRNARVLQIYEGANGIQALDFVLRKLPSNEGKTMASYFNLVSEFICSYEKHTELAEFIEPLKNAQVALHSISKEALSALQSGDRNSVAASAYDLLTAYGIFTVAWTWAEVIATIVTASDLRHVDTESSRRKLSLARVWFAREVSQISGLCRRISIGGHALMSLEDDLI